MEPEALRCVRCGAYYQPQLVPLPLRDGRSGPECVNAAGCDNRKAIVAIINRAIRIRGRRVTGPRLSSTQ